MLTGFSRLTLLLMIIALSASILSYQTGRNSWSQTILILEIDNQSGQRLSSIVIEHGNVNTQEKIQVINLSPGETRIIALNHESGLGFDIEINYSDGRTVSACIGKNSEQSILPVKVLQDGVSSEAS